MERKLATIRKVKEIKPIKDADNIELAIIDGWQCVAKKGEFKEGDLAIYFEIDSLLPDIPEFNFLANKGVKTNADGSAGYRLKTIKLRGEISQGLLLPLSTFKLYNVIEGDDLTEILNIKKYEPAISAQLQGQIRGNFPGFLRKTDAERIQNIYGKYRHVYSDSKWEVTEKLDGTSATFYIKDGEFGVCSRNLDLKETEGNTYWKIAREYKLEEFLKKSSGNFSIQGEIIGEGIQKNPLKIIGQQLRIFNVFDIDKSKYLPYLDRISFVQSLALFLYQDTVKWVDIHVPILNEEALKVFDLPVEVLLEEADGKSKINSKVDREGLVFKNLLNPNINFKTISNKYLLKHE